MVTVNATPHLVSEYCRRLEADEAIHPRMEAVEGRRPAGVHVIMDHKNGNDKINSSKQSSCGDVVVTLAIGLLSDFASEPTVALVDRNRLKYF